MKIVRSPLFYMGDKYKLIGQIKQYFPRDINRFIEPFIGGGSVFLNIKANEYYLNDINSELYQIHNLLLKYSKSPEAFFKKIEEYITYYKLSHSYLKDIVPKELKIEYKKTYYSKFNNKGYNELKKDYNNSNPKDYLILYLLIIYGFNRIIRFNSKGEFNVPTGNVDFNKNVKTALDNYFNITKDKSITLFNLDYIEFINSITLKKDDFIYFDPPYLISQSEYNKLWSESEEIRFLKFLDELDSKKIKFAVSNVIDFKGKTNTLFKEWSYKYKIIEIESNYISFHNNRQKEIREVLVINY